MTPDTRSAEYAAYLARARRRRPIDVQAPYRWNIRRLRLGRTLDIGCGTGRNLASLDSGSVGIDHNEHAITVARTLGLTAYTVDEWNAGPSGSLPAFDSLLVAHVVEHMTFEEAGALLRSYVPTLARGGRIVIITPQPAGFRSDPTHVRYFDRADHERLLTSVDARVVRTYSFPFPTWVGNIFQHNETITVGVR